MQKVAKDSNRSLAVKPSFQSRWLRSNRRSRKISQPASSKRIGRDNRPGSNLVPNMIKCTRYPFTFLLLAVLVGFSLARPRPGWTQAPNGSGSNHPAARPYGIEKRVAWTTSRITGSPEPPYPYRVERVFPKLSFKNPLLITNPPGTERLFVGEQAGKLYSFPRNPPRGAKKGTVPLRREGQSPFSPEKADLFLDLTTELKSWDKAGKVKGIDALYGLAFHPRFAQNRYCYVCYVLNSKDPNEQLPDGSRVSRFTVTDTDPPRCDPKSEKVLITWLGGGHNGGCLQFGPDGYLYISTGDGADPNPPDRLDTGQDISDLLSSILRIDVDHSEDGKPYAVPADNPFVKTPGARPEIWAYGFRNPWRMSFDRATGDLWVGDVGWELWEMVDRVRRGGNYGWSVMEGRQPVRPDSKRGPTPILPPTLDFPHTEAASITGGYVYRGKRLKDLVGTYLCGDWVTRKLWGTRFDSSDRILSHKELAQTTLRIVAFGEDNDGELYIVNYDDAGGIYQLVPNDKVRDTSAVFPRKLSETGLIASVKAHEPAAGVIPFSVNAAQWADYATAERLVALPGTTTIQMYDGPISVPETFYSGQVFFPKDGVLAKTFSLEMERGNPSSSRRLETQILHFDGNAWRGYSYAWNDEQTDATLVPAAGMNRSFTVVDAKAPGGRRKQTWHFPSRAECIQCHNPWAGYTLAFTLAQLNKDQPYKRKRGLSLSPQRDSPLFRDPIVDNQLRAFEHAGLIALVPKEKPARMQLPTPLSDPYDPAAGIPERARSYLHVNCSHCHQFGAGGTADIDLRYEAQLGQMKIVEARPVQGTFEISGASILAPGDPYRSVLFYRMSKLGRGRMPHIGSEIVDEKGLRLIQDWIRTIPPHKLEQDLIEKLRTAEPSPVSESAGESAEERLQRAAQAIAKADGRDIIIAEDRQKAEAQLKAEAASWKVPSRERTDAINRLLSSTSSALLLAQAIADNRIPEGVRPQILAAAMARPESQVRDLFERFIPDDQRIKRLGSLIKPEQILSLKGDAARGKELFFKTAGLQCINCHRVGNTGSALGPDLTQIGKKYSRAQLLESILEPSKSIDPKYVAYLLETTDGQVYTGLLAEKSPARVVLKTVGDKEVQIPAARVATLRPQKTSLMPEQLLRDLTAEQAADLLEFLASLR
jgi:putative heme-binding domain-containing protein